LELLAGPSEYVGPGLRPRPGLVSFVFFQLIVSRVIVPCAGCGVPSLWPVGWRPFLVSFRLSVSSVIFGGPPGALLHWFRAFHHQSAVYSVFSGFSMRFGLLSVQARVRRLPWRGAGGRAAAFAVGLV